MKIAVMGYGTIGSGVVDVLRINKEKITERAGEPVEVKYILDLRDFPGDPMEELIVHDYKTIVNDPEIGIVVETMGGVEPAYTFVKEMLEAGKQVATSNKNLVAAKGAELIKIARDHNVNFQFEASVGGGIPIIRPLNKCLTADEIEEITGILNGTTNYMLTKMAKEGADFDAVLILWYVVSRLILKIFTVKVLQKSVQQISNMQKLWGVPLNFWHPAAKSVEVIPAWWHHLCFPQNILCVE